MSGKKEPEYEEYWDADFLTRFGQDGRSKKKFVTTNGEYLHGYLQAPVAPGLYPAGVLEDKPAMSGNYGPKPVPKVKAAAKTSSGCLTKAATTTSPGFVIGSAAGSSISSTGATYGGSSTRSTATTYGGSSISSAGANYGGSSARSAAASYALSATKAAATKSWVNAAGSGSEPAASGGN